VLQTQEVFDKVRAILVDSLGIDEDEVKPESKLTVDLGAESIDFLDIVFKLEKTFNLKVSRGEMFPEDLFSDTSLVKDGKLTADGLAKLQARLPFFDLDEFAGNPVVKNFQHILTVSDMCRFVESKLG
jgi:acyl carrier protein